MQGLEDLTEGPHSVVRYQELAPCFVVDRAYAEHMFDGLRFLSAGQAMNSSRNGWENLLLRNPAAYSPVKACLMISLNNLDVVARSSRGTAARRSTPRSADRQRSASRESSHPAQPDVSAGIHA